VAPYASSTRIGLEEGEAAGDVKLTATVFAVNPNGERDYAAEPLELVLRVSRVALSRRAPFD